MKAMSSKILLPMCILMLIAIAILFSGTVSSGAKALKDNYFAAFREQKETAYQEKYDKYKNSAEAKYHVSNRVTINIGNIREEQKLEVLKVSDIEFSIMDKVNNQGKIDSWLEVPGEGTYVVDLRAGEYIVDNERAHVLARVPYPELINIHIDYENVQKHLFKDDIFNGSYREGENLASQQLTEAESLINKELTSNQKFYESAKDAAKRLIENLIKQLNSEVPDLSVDVEFF